MLKVEKVWESVPKFEKVCAIVLAANSSKSVPKPEKVWESELKVE